LVGTYAIFHEAAERAAKKLGFRYGNELQSVVWDAMRRAYGQLTDLEVARIERLWAQVDQGRLNRETAAQRVIDILITKAKRG
jgi:hypothetical protein